VSDACQRFGRTGASPVERRWFTSTPNTELSSGQSFSNSVNRALRPPQRQTCRCSIKSTCSYPIWSFRWMGRCGNVSTTAQPRFHRISEIRLRAHFSVSARELPQRTACGPPTHEQRVLAFSADRQQNKIGDMNQQSRLPKMSQRPPRCSIVSNAILLPRRARWTRVSGRLRRGQAVRAVPAVARRL
jgi:hypothetical protein